MLGPKPRAGDASCGQRQTSAATRPHDDRSDVAPGLRKRPPQAALPLLSGDSEMSQLESQNLHASTLRPEPNRPASSRWVDITLGLERPAARSIEEARKEKKGRVQFTRFFFGLWHPPAPRGRRRVRRISSQGRRGRRCLVGRARARGRHMATLRPCPECAQGATALHPLLQPTQASCVMCAVAGSTGASGATFLDGPSLSLEIGERFSSVPSSSRGLGALLNEAKISVSMPHALISGPARC